MRAFIVFIYIILSFCTWVSELRAQSVPNEGWQLIHEEPGTFFSQIYFTNRNTGYVCGSKGKVLRTRDAGKTWQPLPTGTRADLFDVKFMDSQTGFAVGKEGTLLKTVNGGDSWTPLTVTPQDLSFIYVQGKDTVFVAGGNSWGDVLRSTDRGQTWTNLYPPPPAGNIQLFSCLQILPNGGIIGGGGVSNQLNNENISVTSDGGRTWTDLLAPFPYTIRRITALSDGLTLLATAQTRNGYGIDDSCAVIRSTDGGYTWKTVFTDRKGGLIDIQMLDDRIGYVVGDYGRILKTENRGLTWKEMPPALTGESDWFDNYLFGMHFFSADTGYVCGSEGRIMMTPGCRLRADSVSVLPPACPDEPDYGIHVWLSQATRPTQFSLDSLNYQFDDEFFFGLKPGTYSVWFIDAKGCRGKTQVHIPIPSTPKFPIPNLRPFYCSSDTGFILLGNQPRTFFDGPGVVDNKFYPARAGAGTHTIQMTDSSQSCVRISAATIAVRSAPEIKTILAAFSEESVFYRKDAAPYVLTVQPVPSTGQRVQFSGAGVVFVNNKFLFKPNKTTGNQVTITARLTDSRTGCTATLTKTFTIVDALDFQVRSVLPADCKADSIQILLSGASRYEISPSERLSCHPCKEVRNSQVKVRSDRRETLTIKAYWGKYGLEKQITVPVLPALETAVLRNASRYCLGDGPIVLRAEPSGGDWTGAGVLQNQFSPSRAGSGAHLLTYQWKSGNCVRNQIFRLEVSPPPTRPQITGLKSGYCILERPVSVKGIPSGGTFKGKGMQGSVFDPQVAGKGTHEITYQYGTICPETTSVRVRVSHPEVDFEIPKTFCRSDHSYLLTAQPPGGWFTGSGVSGNRFYPDRVAGVSGTITYYGRDSTDGCTYSLTRTFNVWNCKKEAIFSEEEVSVYPNPFDNILNINGITSETAFELTDLNGKKLMEGILLPSHCEIDTQFLTSGMYLLKIRHRVIKMVKQ